MHTATTKLAPGLAALGAAVLLALGGPAQAAQTTTLHLVDHAQRGIGFFPAHAPRTGDTVGFGGRVSGDDHGTNTGTCTVIRRALLCTIEVRLSRGTLSAQGLMPQHSRKHPVAIIGGTGAYAGAHGVALVTDRNATTTVVDVTLTR